MVPVEIWLTIHLTDGGSRQGFRTIEFPALPTENTALWLKLGGTRDGEQTKWHFEPTTISRQYDEVEGGYVFFITYFVNGEEIEEALEDIRQDTLWNFR